MPANMPHPETSNNEYMNPGDGKTGLDQAGALPSEPGVGQTDDKVFHFEESEANPEWWAEKHETAWSRAQLSIRRAFDQIKADLAGEHGARVVATNLLESLRQMASVGGDKALEVAPPAAGGALHLGKDDAHRIVKDELGRQGRQRAKDLENAVRYGYGASAHYVAEWSEALEPELKREWERLHAHSPWSEVRDLVELGWDHGRDASRKAEAAKTIVSGPREEEVKPDVPVEIYGR